MRLLTLLISAILLGATCSQAYALDIQKRSIRYIEKTRDYAPSFKNQGMPLKANRLSNNEGNIVLTYDESLPDSIQTAFLVAKELWESKLSMTQPIFISVSFEPLGDDISMICDVIYSETPDLMGCPCALASQISNSPWGTIDSPDGYIILGIYTH